ncbi:hypothetical protein AJ78_07464 [Emergomyces pasteurianus Ep9510]|uniref:Protein N-terminal and lysine N-methyltransferase EFM7 n=1 Tax=Emergomyces pasteurianus Ep9510 TaxID=1447872 RepID=A0A1J9PVE6_9EURO|nr:hypothetical protein AJ78_07464 [Emergomyces pasteurianus Ep9510]
MASTSDSEAETEFGNLFQDPEGFLAPAKEATFEDYTMRSGQTIKLRLVGSFPAIPLYPTPFSRPPEHHSIAPLENLFTGYPANRFPIEGFLLWNAGKTSADYLESMARKWVEGKDILELGAGAGLPSLICAILGARTVVVTDYPDIDLVENMRINAQACESLLSSGGADLGQKSSSPLRVEGYKWGADPETVLKHIPKDASVGADGRHGFDLMILADVIYNHPQHGELIASVRQTLKRTRDAVAFVVFTPYQPWLFEKIAAFFPRVEESGFVVTKLFENLVEKVMFEEDPGDEKLRRTVFGYELRWKEEELDKR